MNLNELLDRLRRLVKLLAAVQQLVPLLREVVVLFERLLVHVGELLQRGRDTMEFLQELG